MTKDFIPTSLGYVAKDDYRVRGSWAFADLAGTSTFWETMSHTLGGPNLSANDQGMLDDIVAVLTNPDPRIPVMKIVRLASCYGSTLKAFGVLHLSQEGAVLGVNIPKTIAAYILDVSERIENHANSEESMETILDDLLASRKRIPGFGAVARAHDERFLALEKCVQKRGRSHHKYWSLLKTMEKILKTRLEKTPNSAAAIAVILLDMGFDLEHIAGFSTLLGINVLAAQAVEGAKQKPEILQTLPLQKIEYCGAPARVSPKKLAEKNENK